MEDTEAPTGTSPGTQELPIPILQSQAGPCGQSGRGQVGGHCCAWGVVAGDTDPCLWDGTGSGTGPVGGGGGHTKAILGQLAWGSQLCCWQPVESGWHMTSGRQVLTGVEAGLPIGEKTLATCTVCSRREAEQVGLGRGPF